MSYRDLMCGDPRLARTGEVLTMSGWVGRRRDHGGLIFIDLRDRTGSTQLVLDQIGRASCRERVYSSV